MEAEDCVIGAHTHTHTKSAAIDRWYSIRRRLLSFFFFFSDGDEQFMEKMNGYHGTQ